MTQTVGKSLSGAHGSRVTTGKHGRRQAWWQKAAKSSHLKPHAASIEEKYTENGFGTLTPTPSEIPPPGRT